MLLKINQVRETGLVLESWTAVPVVPLWDKILHSGGGIDARSVIGPLRRSSNGNVLALVSKGRTGSRHASGFVVGTTEPCTIANSEESPE